TVTVYNVTGTSYTITGLTAATSYGIRVSAHNVAGYGPWNDPAVVGTTSATTSTNTAPTETGRWYASTSSWNTPIPSNPQLAPDNASMISKLTGLYNRPWIGPTSSSTPSIAYAGATTPNVTVQVNYPSCNAKTMQI